MIFFSAIRIRKLADLIPDADRFFIIAVNSFMVVVCVHQVMIM